MAGFFQGIKFKNRRIIFKAAISDTGLELKGIQNYAEQATPPAVNQGHDVEGEAYVAVGSPGVPSLQFDCYYSPVDPAMVALIKARDDEAVGYLQLKSLFEEQAVPGAGVNGSVDASSNLIVPSTLPRDLIKRGTSVVIATKQYVTVEQAASGGGGLSAKCRINGTNAGEFVASAAVSAAAISKIGIPGYETEFCPVRVLAAGEDTYESTDPQSLLITSVQVQLLARLPKKKLSTVS